jgi:PKD repeat protein
VTYADKATGNLHSVSWNNGAPDAGTDQTVSGPGIDGVDWRARGLFALSAPSPTASFTNSCTNLSCTFNAGASTAGGGTITSYAWTFGDGGTATGVSTSNTYAAAGSYNVTLTVTNSLGGTASTSRTVTVSNGPPPGGNITFVAAAHVTGNGSTETVNIPSGVQAGDGMLLLASVANVPTTITPPAGWALVSSTPPSLTSITTQVFARVAQAGDAGDPVSIGYSGAPHATLQLLAYRGTNNANPVAAVAVSTASGASTITSPTINDAASNTWVVSLFTAKSSTVTSWSVGGGQVSRDVDNGSGSGRVNSVAVDSGGSVAPGVVGGIVGTTDQAYGGADAFTIVLTP